MKHPTHPSAAISPSPVHLGRSNHRDGAALVIALAFVVLLTGLIVAFFSRAISERQVSNSSANETKVSLFAQGALDAIVGDLKQEIVDGSGPNAVTITTGNSTTTIYYPAGPAAASPAISGFTPVISAGNETDGLANLLKESVYNSPSYSGPSYVATGTSRAANVLSTGTSINGRTVSKARWNKPLLLQKQNPASTTALDPVNSFVPPDWVLVARDGSTPPAATYSNSMQWTPNNPGTIVGRYAYTIYNEGGLLDMNVAGYPSSTGTIQSSYKAALSYADLTQLQDPTGNSLPPAVWDQIVGWRNYATTQPGGRFPSLDLTGTASATNYYNYVLWNPHGFLKAWNKSIYNNQTDRGFSSRQELINMMTQGLGPSSNIATAQNLLQYLCTFSRGVNQPSYAPDPNKPQILSGTAGGNDATGLDSPTLLSGTGDSRINPSFLSVRVSGTFRRNDGSLANVGDPLVKRRFALNRLAWITYSGPSSTRNLSNPSSTGSDADIYSLENTYGISQSWLAQGTPENILAYFGLVWHSASSGSPGYWAYTHASNPTSGHINKLYEVVNLSREPDFFELLKSAVCAGSIAKQATIPPSAGTTGTNVTTAYAYQSTVDGSVDYAVMQMGVNIIDQYTTDGYPTIIQWINSGNTSQFVGVKNLPYLNRIRCMVIKAAEPMMGPSGVPGYGTQPSYLCPACVQNFDDSTSGTVPVSGQNTLTDTGVGIAMLYPELWNPHDWNPSNVDRTLGNPRPTKFEVTGSSMSDANHHGFSFAGSAKNVNITSRAGSGDSQSDWLGNAFYNTQYSPGYVTKYGFPNCALPYSAFAPPPTAAHLLTEANTAIDITLPTDQTAASYFREPTLILRPVSSTSGYSVVGTGLSSMLGSPPLSHFASPSGAGILSGVKSGSNNYANGDTELQDPPNQPYIGFYLNGFPLRWVAWVYSGSNNPSYPSGPGYDNNNPAFSGTYYNFGPRTVSNLPGRTNEVETTFFRVKCQDANGNWITYDTKAGEFYNANDGLMIDASHGFFNPQNGVYYWTTVDPRSGRFGMMQGGVYGGTVPNTDLFPPFIPGYGDTETPSVGWLSRTQGILCTQRMGESAGATLDLQGSMTGLPSSNSGYATWWMTSGIGWYPGSLVFSAGTSKLNPSLRPGLLTQNNPNIINDGKIFDSGSSSPNKVSQYYADADGIVRRAMSTYVPGDSTPSSATTLTGLPMATANTFVAGSGTPVLTRTAQSASRPVVLNRPFRSVADLGYAFSGTPWKNIDFFTPESGSAALLDVFCLSDSDDPNALVAGKVDLNTRQAPVLQAVIAGAYQDEWNADSSTVPGGPGSLSQTIAQGLVARTTGTTGSLGPLRNVSELVGKWVSSVTLPTGGIDGSKSYDGFSADLSTLLTSGTNSNIQRFREAPMRSLINTGQTRVWNLMIDLVAQVGRYPTSATNLNNFMVEGEQRYWVHLAIDRFTGQVIDKEIEVVKE